MTITGRDKYSTSYGQKGKEETAEEARVCVTKAKNLIEETKMFSSVSTYKPKDADYYISNAPAVPVITPKGKKLVIAPDILCKLNGETIWAEVKDKPQRIFYSDTGCDIHQYVGYWSINRYRKEPVLFMFIDPPVSKIKLNGIKPDVKENFIERCRRFVVGDQPIFYGNWLSHLAEFDMETKYPKCFQERSRQIPMKIVYFEIRKMIPFSSAEVLKGFLRTYKGAIATPDFKIFDLSTNKVIEHTVFNFTKS